LANGAPRNDCRSLSGGGLRRTRPIDIKLAQVPPFPKRPARGLARQRRTKKEIEKASSELSPVWGSVESAKPLTLGSFVGSPPRGPVPARIRRRAISRWRRARFARRNRRSNAQDRQPSKGRVRQQNERRDQPSPRCCLMFRCLRRIPRHYRIKSATG
jgi:hypothetical protein